MGAALIRLGARNNGPCVPLSVVGGAEVASRPHLINVDDVFQKDTKAVKARGCEGGEGGGGQKALLKLQTDLRMPRNL